MSGEAATFLRCPVCGHPLSGSGTGLRCPSGHTFDRARQGYVNLGGGRHTGDTPAMVAARARFLDRGHFAPLTGALATAAGAAITTAGTAGPHLVIDAGAGTGHHLAGVLDAVPDAVGLALDAAKPAVRRAARAHPRATAVVCDTWRRLPVADASATVLLNVFAPRNGREFHRVLRGDGTLLVVTPTPRHLAELVGEFDLLRVDPAKPDRLAASLARDFAHAGDRTLEWTMSLDHQDAAAAVAMGPSAWHADTGAITARLSGLPHPLSVTASVVLSTWRPRPPATIVDASR